VKEFMDEDFLLQTETARILYHKYAEKAPIFDFHSHLDPEEIAEDKNYQDLGEAWLSRDHYKWRLMRANGIEEKYCTGNTSFKDKFLKWAETLRNAVHNPLYHWSHLKLKRYFHVNQILSPENAGEIFNHCSELLKKPEYSVRNSILVFSGTITEDTVLFLVLGQNLTPSPTIPRDRE
jgi:glucuronate isomerase